MTHGTLWSSDDEDTPSEASIDSFHDCVGFTSTRDLLHSSQRSTVVKAPHMKLAMRAQVETTNLPDVQYSSVRTLQMKTGVGTRIGMYILIMLIFLTMLTRSDRTVMQLTSLFLGAMDFSPRLDKLIGILDQHDIYGNYGDGYTKRSRLGIDGLTLRHYPSCMATSIPSDQQSGHTSIVLPTMLPTKHHLPTTLHCCLEDEAQTYGASEYHSLTLSSMLGNAKADVAHLSVSYYHGSCDSYVQHENCSNLKPISTGHERSLFKNWDLTYDKCNKFPNLAHDMYCEWGQNRPVYFAWNDYAKAIKLELLLVRRKVFSWKRTCPISNFSSKNFTEAKYACVAEEPSGRDAAKLSLPNLEKKNNSLVQYYVFILGLRTWIWQAR